MSRTLLFKRTSNTALVNIVGANGELIIDTTNRTLTVHDGVTPGGTRLATEAFAIANGGGSGIRTYDPPTDDPNNTPVAFTQSNNTRAQQISVSQVFSSGIYHYNVNLNSSGKILSISAWGPGATGPVGQY
jgi:hypothetical protein